MSRTLTTRARAKVNLDLHVLGRRADGYHELDSLVAFAGIGDGLALDPAAPLGLAMAGPYAAGLDADGDNLVMRAARAFRAAFPATRAGAFHLTKRLPVASGIGGGSADAAAALRLLARLNGIPLATPRLTEIAATIGADVPVCLASRARRMSGIGERLGPPLRLPPLPALLVNPGLPVETAAVFRALGLAPGSAPVPQGALEEPADQERGSSRATEGRPAIHAGASPSSAPAWIPDLRFAASGMTRAFERKEARFAALPDLHETLAASRNDLEPPALEVAPVVADLLDRLRALPGCRLARMSGSGATCFALFDDTAAGLAAARLLTRERPGWWIRSTVLR